MRSEEQILDFLTTETQFHFTRLLEILIKINNTLKVSSRTPRPRPPPNLIIIFWATRKRVIKA